MNSFESIDLRLKYKMFTPTGCKDIGIRIFEFVAKTKNLFTKIMQRELLLQTLIF